MFALDPHFALLAAQCILSLVAFPSPATAIAVHSPHSDHREFSGGLHNRGRHSVLLAPGRKERHPSEERGSSSVQRASRKHEPHDAERSRSTPNHHVTDLKGGVGKRQPPDQQFFQARELPLPSIVVGLLDPLLKTTDTTIKSLAGSDPLSPLLVGRHHHDYHYHDHGGEVVIYDRPSSIHIHKRSVRHTHRPTKRDQQRVPGNVDIIQGDNKIASLVLQPGGDGYELNASRDNSTTMYLVKSAPVAESVLALDPLANFVQLQVPISGPQSVVPQSYCATFDPDPPVPSQMTAEPCFPPSQASEHKSQIFTYNPDSGFLQPVHSATVENGGTPDTLTPVANAKSENVGNNLAEYPVRMWARDSGDPVTLAFVPLVAALVEDYSSSSETVSVTTVTVTETATQANPSLTTAGVGTSTSTAATDVSESTASSSASQSSPGMFDVDVALPSATSSSISPEASTNSDSSSSGEPSPTADPDAIASSIASTDTSATTTSEASTQPTPASLLVQITRPEDPSTSTPAPASSA